MIYAQAGGVFNSSGQLPINFLKKMYTLIENQEGEIFAVDVDRIERFPMADSYSDHGQECGSYAAGDWLTIETQEAADKVNAWWREEYEESEKVWEVGDSISAYDDLGLFDQFTEQSGFELNQLQVIGFNYHDGHNWASIIVDMDNGEEAPYSYCDDELIEKFNAEIDSEEETKKTAFGTTYETESFVLFDGNSAGDWASYDVTLK